MSDRLLADTFVGRRAELSVFEQAIDDARQGLPSAVLVGGDAGIGKTTIVSEAARRAGVAVYLGRSTHIGGDVIPLAPLADLLRRVRRFHPTLLTDVPALAPLHHWLAPNSLASDSPDLPRGGVFAAVLELLDQLASADTLLIGFEDLHWADAATWELFEYLDRNLIDERVVLVGTYRANEVAGNPSQRGRLGELSRLPGTRRIQLQGLDHDEVAARIASLIGATPPRALVDEVAARGQGNPFFTGELVAAHLTGESIPTALSDLIFAEIAGLDDDANLVLGAVAAIGRETRHDLLSAITTLADHELEVAVRSVIDARLIVVDNDAYRFRHPLIGEVVYADLLPPQRSRLHSAIAATLLEEPADLLTRVDRAGELAFHLDRAGDVKGAFTASLAAADAAETVAPGAAFSHLERAFQLWDAAGASATAASRGDRLWQAAEIATSTVGNARAASLARAAFELGPPPLGEAWGHERLGRYLWSSGELDASRAEFELAAQLLLEHDDASAPLVFAGLGQAALMAADNVSAERWSSRVFEVVPNPEANPAAWVMARRVLGIARSNQGDPASAVELCRQAVAAAPNAQSRALATLYLCVAVMDAGDYQAAVNTALDAVADAQLTGLDEGFGCYFDSLASEALIRLGRWPDATANIARHPVPNTLPVGLLRLARTQAMLAARLGDADQALNRLDEAHSLPIDGWHQCVLDATTADVHLQVGRWDAAATAANHGWETTRDSAGLWAARFVAAYASATVEQVLDRIARREPVDIATVVVEIGGRIDAVRASAELVGNSPSRETAAQLALATASLTRLGTPDPDAWAVAAAGWIELGDRPATAAALLREAEAAALTGLVARAASTIRDAYSIASDLSAPRLIAEIEAVSRRTRISVKAPTRVTIDHSSAHSLGLTPRELEVLALVAAGRTNRQIGEELYVSDKTASVHVSNILRKLGVNTRVDAAAIAQRLGAV